LITIEFLSYRRIKMLTAIQENPRTTASVAPKGYTVEEVFDHIDKKLISAELCQPA
jgi:hypothetical protein